MSTGRGEPFIVSDSGAWTWFNDPRAIVVGRFLLVGSVDAAGFSRCDVVDLETGRQVDAQRLSTLTERDDHNNPALLHLGDHRVLAAWSRHNTDRFWSSRVGTIGDDGRIGWEDERRHPVNAGVTYCNLHRLSEENGRIYNFIRGLNFNPNVLYSDDGGATWGEPAVLFKIGDGRVRPYVKYAGDGRGRIDFLFTDGHPRDVRTSIYHCYYEAEHLHRSDGEIIAPMPSRHHESIAPEAGTRLYDGGEQRAWVWDITRLADGTLAAVYIVAADDAQGADLRYHYAEFDETAGRWNERQIAFAGTHLYVPENHYAGGITLDPRHRGVVYLSADVHPRTGEPNEADRYQLWRGTKEGEAGWRFEPLTETPISTPEADDLRPYVVRSHHPHADRTCLVWFRGRYTRYQNYETQVMGLLP